MYAKEAEKENKLTDIKSLFKLNFFFAHSPVMFSFAVWKKSWFIIRISTYSTAAAARANVGSRKELYQLNVTLE